MIEEFVETDAGMRLFLRSLPASGKAKALLVIVHGFNSHSGYYLWASAQLAELGLTIYAPDLRGRGRSDGERFYAETFGDYVDDISSIVALAKGRHPGLPIFLFGHSAGGVASCLYVLDNPGELSGLICESFAYRLPAPDFALAVLKGLSHVAPHAHVLKLNNTDFSRDPAVVATMDTDPLITGESQPTSTVAAMVRADERLKLEFGQITLPLLILHGTADKAAKSTGSEAFYANAGSTDKTLKLYDGHLHDLLNDIGRDEVMRDIRTWLAERLDQLSPQREQ